MTEKIDVSTAAAGLVLAFYGVKGLITKFKQKKFYFFKAFMPLAIFLQQKNQKGASNEIKNYNNHICYDDSFRFL